MQIPMQWLAVDSFNTSHVKVNLLCGSYCKISSVVSIHPMLKLIGAIRAYKKDVHFVSIHPMLKLIIERCRGFPVECDVSIHPMLKLILWKLLEDFSQRRFNTSHVKVNRFLEVFHWQNCNVSIHPMLKLICLIPPRRYCVILFQYIPC